MLKNVKTLLAISLLLFAPVLKAGFDVKTESELEDNPDKYGNAHTVPFQKAMQGDDSTSLNEDRPLSDSKSLAMDVPKIGNTWYVSTHLGRPNTKLRKVKNTSSTTGGISGLPLTSTEETDHLFNFSLAGGYRWIKWAWDAEIVLAEGMEYNLNPFTPGFPESANNKINNNLVFFNLHYFFPRYFHWVPEALAPHINFGLGPNVQRVKSDLIVNNQTLASKTKNNFTLAYNFSFGLAYRITNNFLADITWRYVDYGKAKMGPLNATIGGVPFSGSLESKDFTANGFHFGIIYEMD